MRPYRLVPIAVLLLAATLRGSDRQAAAPAEAAAPPALDALVERVRTTFDVPGMAVAIVKDDRVVLAGG